MAVMLCADFSYAEQVVPPPEFYKASSANQKEAASPTAKIGKDSGKSSDYTVIGGKKVQSEDLLNAEGNWNLIEQSEENDPAQAHLKAREKVDPKRRKAMAELSPHFKPDAQSGKDGKFRVLRLEPEGEEEIPEEEGAQGEEGDIQVAAAPSVAKPTHTLAEPEVIQKVKSLFGEDWQKTGVVPPNDDPESRQAVPVAASKAQTLPVPETVAVEVAETKAEETAQTDEEKPILGGFKKLLTSVFSDDVEEADAGEISVKEETEIAQNRQDQNAQLTVAALSLSPESMQGHEIVAPPPLPARKLAEIMPAAGGDKNVPIPQQKPYFAAPVEPAVHEAVIREAASAKNTRFGGGEEEERRLPNAGQVRVLAIRGGNYPEMARIAIDFSNAVQYRVAIDDIRNVLRVKFENTFWEPKLLGDLGENPLLGSYVVQEDENGDVLLEIRLKKKTAITETMVLRPGATQNHRVVIDLKA